MKKTNAALLLTVGLLLAGCSNTAPAEGTAEPAPTSSADRATTTPSAKPTRPADRDNDGVPDIRDDFPDDATRFEQLRYPSGDPVPDGYPLIVDTAQLDSRLANWIKTPQAVALAPGVYAGYNPAVTDLSVYLDGPADGDCAVRDLYAFGGGACWNGVLLSPAEPAQ